MSVTLSLSSYFFLNRYQYKRDLTNKQAAAAAGILIIVRNSFPFSKGLIS